MLNLTLKELETLALIVRKSDNINSCDLEGLINDAIEYEKQSLRAKYERSWQGL